MAEAFARAKQLKQLRADLDPSVCSMAFRCAMSGLIREWLLDPQLISLQRDGLAMIDTLLNSFAAEPMVSSRVSVARRRRA
jgi:hypothetical protein